MSLKGKTAFITGATGGIGIPLIRLLDDEGVQIQTYDQEISGDLLCNLNEVALGLKHNTPDILINLAGINQFSVCESQDYRHLIDLNLLAPIVLAQAVIPGMKAKGNGHIVNIGSMVAEIPMPFLSGYVASKAGLKGFSESIRREVSNDGILVTHINPRAIRTEMNRGAMAEFNSKTHASQDSPEWVAKQIFNAIRSGTERKSLGRPERLFALIHALLPKLMDKAMKNQRKVALQVLSPTNNP